MEKRRPTLGAQRRFEQLAGNQLAARCSFPRAEGGPEEGGEGIEATIVDISVGCTCLRVPLSQPRAEVMRTVADGDPIEIVVSDAPGRSWTVLGHLAWVWVPSMEGDDVIGSLGVDIAGVIEDDQRIRGKLKRLLSRDQAVDVDLTPRPVESPARRRQREREKG